MTVILVRRGASAKDSRIMDFSNVAQCLKAYLLAFARALSLYKGILPLFGTVILMGDVGYEEVAGLKNIHPELWKAVGKRVQ